MPRLSKIGAAALAAFGWTSGTSAVSASYLVVAGGGGGGKRIAGAGGAGGLLTGTASLNPSSTYTITVGAGGAGSSNYNSAGTNGSNSVFNTATSIGGGGGAGSGIKNGVSGGSGGGSADVGTVGTGTVGQGNNGGVGSGTASAYGGGGGGGASAVGGNGSSTVAGSGGAGTASSISGSSVTYAGGGGGGSNGGTAGTGGSGGGGAGTTSDLTATAGTANLGGGGGGCGGLSTATGTTFGGQGGSGIVIISYVGAQQFSGGVVTSSGGNTIHTFTTSGTLGPVTPLSANYLVVAGGGAGSFNYGGGGGAGGLLSGSALVIDPYSTYVVTVGAGGVGSTGNQGTSGSNSSFSAYATAAIGGGYGGCATVGQNTGASGGSGGGGGGNKTGAAGGAGTSGQGFAGGAAVGIIAVSGAAGGGGGSSAVGVTATSGAGGAGGAGTVSSITGTSVTYAGGGGGNADGTQGAGGSGGGGAAGNPATNGTANLGGGGGGSGTSSGNGGSGVVIISYAGSTQLMAGGVVTIAGGNVIHTFNSSGYLSPLTLLTRSLRFRASATAYLSRTYGSSGSTTTATFSAWIKRGQLTSGGSFPIQGYSNGGNQTQQIAYQSDSLNFYVYNSAAICNVSTSAVYRDPAAWYHVVFQLDSTQATSTDRVRIYVNGVQQATTGTQPAQNANLVLSIATQYNIGVIRTNGADGIFDGYMAEVNFIDGQALAPTAFGTVNSYGVWQPITYGGSYGNNGFRLPFTNNASTTTLGYDFSPQGNNWTTNNISVTAGSTYDSMTDVPTLTSATAANYCVMNPLDNSSTTITNGNLQLVSSSATWCTTRSTFVLPNGSWYMELTATSGTGNGNSFVGLAHQSTAISTISGGTFVGGTSTSYAYSSNGNIYNNGSVLTATGVTWASGSVIGISYDGSSLKFYKNNTLVTTVSSLSYTNNYCITTSFYSSDAGALNFGQRPFTYTPPSGYLALNTFNL